MCALAQSRARRADERFLSLPGGFAGVRWDTTFSAAYFISGDSLCSVEWQWGAAPTVLSRLPEGMAVADWWFNPDSACWQLLTIVWQSESDHDYYSKYFGELWQISRDDTLWRRIRSDTLSCSDEACTQWEAADGPLGSRVRMIRWESLASSSGSAALTDESEHWTDHAPSGHCGAVLIPSLSGPMVLDLESQTTLRSLPWNSEGVHWVKAPRGPPSPR